ncbi:MAG TPA: hypothetical protein VHT00_14070 [Stellaceae bacterium]|jgi:hypothetical protein|nr:hypothetical protein [Stellaceae bacterium]
MSRLPDEMSKFSYTDLAQCAERELNKRRYVYPKQIAAGKMSQQQANAELDMMRTIGELMRGLAAKERLL